MILKPLCNVKHLLKYYRKMSFRVKCVKLNQFQVMFSKTEKLFSRTITSAPTLTRRLEGKILKAIIVMSAHLLYVNLVCKIHLNLFELML